MQALMETPAVHPLSAGPFMTETQSLLGMLATFTRRCDVISLLIACSEKHDGHVFQQAIG